MLVCCNSLLSVCCDDVCTGSLWFMLSSPSSVIEFVCTICAELVAQNAVVSSSLIVFALYRLAELVDGQT